jgi:hypothetical protein
MSRKVMRVPMDFNWPLNKPWSGYINPHYRECAACNGASYTRAGLALERRMAELMHDADLIGPLTIGLAGRAPCAFGHDCIDRHNAIKKILVAAGLEDDWNVCKPCHGSGIDPSAEAAYESWESSDPPKGDGWQIWETISEGSPISPVMESPEALARWMSVKSKDGFGDSYDQWLAMIHAGQSICSMVIQNGRLMSGVAAVSELATEKPE